MTSSHSSGAQSSGSPVRYRHTPQDNFEFGYLLRFIQKNDIRVVLVDGPRGVGKSSFTSRLTAAISSSYYKTWGSNQRDERHRIQSYGLELPQATYFVLDYLSQVPQSKLVVCDRSGLTALSYQRDKYLPARDLHEYYVHLLAKSRAVLLYLESDRDEICRRRIAREAGDEEYLHLKSERYAHRIVSDDVDMFERGICAFEEAGLICRVTYELDVALCNCYVPFELKVDIPVKDEAELEKFYGEAT